MAIASMVCGIIGLLVFLFSVLSIFDLQNKIAQLQDDLVSLVVKLQLENRLSIIYFFFVISIVLIILAFIFGIIERKKGKTNKYYGMATAGFIMGLVGIILPILYIILATSTAVIVYNMNKKGKAEMDAILSTFPPIGNISEYSYFDRIGSITIRTRDYSTVSVEVLLGYDLSDEATSTELMSRTYELRDFVRRYFSQKTTVELSPENEENIKQELLEQLNRFLDNARIRIVRFNRLDFMEE